MAEPDDMSRVQARIIRLEECLMHTDRLLANLNEAVCSLQDRVTEQDRKLASLELLLGRLLAPPEQRSFEDERPPHY
jgi:uncharacterized coiled-coil protein SlyX